MFNWHTINKTYVYDGSFEGLLSIVFNCYIDWYLLKFIAILFLNFFNRSVRY